MCFVVEESLQILHQLITCSHQGNFEPSHIAQTENEKSSSILAQVGLDAQLCTQGQSLLMVLVMLGQLLNLAKLRVDRLGLDYGWCNLFPWELAKLIDTT